MNIPFLKSKLERLEGNQNNIYMRLQKSKQRLAEAKAEKDSREDTYRGRRTKDGIF